MDTTPNLDTAQIEPQVLSVNTHTNTLLAGSFKWMAIGLLISAVASFITLLIPTLINFIAETGYGFLIMAVIEIGLVWYLSARIATMSKQKAKGFFILYSAISGMTLSIIVLIYTSASILSIFLSTAAMFGLLSLYGMRTKKDLTKYGRLALFALFGLIISFIINIFLNSTVFDLILSWVGVIIFTVLTAYDVQKIKNMGSTIITDEDLSKAQIIGALTLYLDFINLFLNLLRIFGRRR